MMTDATVVAERPLGLGRFADAIGHSVLVFAFLPTLASLPSSLRFEVSNGLNLTDPVVLAFVPVRGVILLLHAFKAGVVPGVLAGIIHGLLVCAFAARTSGAGAGAGRGVVVGVGAVAGALAALAVVLATVGRGGGAALATGPVLFELASGIVCGAIAAPTAVRLARGR
jgi:hypothetical protein